MLLSSRRSFVLTFAALAGCGFRPAYAPGGPAEGLRGRVSVQPPKDVNDFTLLKRLEERLGRPQASRYILNYQLDLSESGLAISPTQEITRFHIVGKARFSLTDTANGQVVKSGLVDSFTSYSATGTTISTQVAKQDAYRRLMVILADQIVTHLLSPDTGDGQ